MSSSGRTKAGNAWQVNPDRPRCNRRSARPANSPRGVMRRRQRTRAPAIISAIPAKVAAFDHVGHGLAGRIQQACVLSDRGWMQVDHHRARRQEAGERKSGVYAPPVEGQPVAGMIRRGRQTDQELCFGGRRHQQLHDALADDRVLAEQGRKLAQEPFRTGRSMILSPSRRRMHELAYGLGALLARFLVETPHDPNSPRSAAAARRAAPFRRSKTSVGGPPSATAPDLKVDRCDIFAKSWANPVGLSYGKWLD